MAFQPAPNRPNSVFQTQQNQFRIYLKGDNLPFYQHQVSAVQAIFNHHQQQNNIALTVLPTGAGKTGVAVLACYAIGARKVLIVTPSLIISSQIYEAFSRNGFLHQRGILNENNATLLLPTIRLIRRTNEIEVPFSEVTVVNAQKFGANSNVDLDQIDNNEFDMIIVDEAHHYPAETWLRIVRHFQQSNAFILFLTATPYNNNEYILPNYPPVFSLTRQEAVNRRIIRNIRFRDIGNVGDDMNQKITITCNTIQTELQNRNRTANFMHKAMIIAGTVAEANNIATQYGDQAHSYVANTPRTVLDDFINGTISVLVIVGKLLEGFDHPNISVLGIIRNIQPQSRVLFSQFVGRAVRRVNENDNHEALVISHITFNQLNNFNQLDQLAIDHPGVDEY